MEKRSDLLRKKAVQKLKELDVKPDFKEFGSDIKKLLEELSIYQIELEHQNKELQEAHERIEKSERKFKDLFNRAPVSYLIIDEENIIHDFNAPAIALLGIDNNDIGHIKFHKFVFPEDQDSYYLFFKNNIKKHMPSQLEIRLVDKNNNIFFALLDVLPDFNKEDDILKYRIIITDIQHVKNLELELKSESEKLKKSELKFRQFIERSHDIFFYLDLQSKMIEYVSPNVEDITGFSVDYCLSLSLIDQKTFIGDEYKNIFEDIVHNLIKNKDIENYSYDRLFQLLFKSGKWHWVEGSFGLILDSLGNPSKMIGSIHDITRRVENEQQLIMAKDRAEESEKLKSAFLANMSHEIRTPMNGILGFAQILKSADRKAVNYNRYVNIIEKSGERLLEIINNLIDISKYESGQMKVKNTSFKINELFKYLFGFFEPEANSKGLTLEYECGLPDDKSMVISDKEKVYAIMTNFIKNALKYTDEGSVSFGYVVIGNTFKFYVKDTGIGIPEKSIDSVFKRFVQVDSSLSSNYEGAGLGLAICKAYVDLLDGKIGVNSILKEGSEFYFILKLEPQTEEIKDVTVLPEKDIDDTDRKYNILIADDDETSRMLLEAMLLTKIDNVFFASNGKVAVDIVNDHPEIELIFMDIKMPEMDGYEASRIIKKSHPDITIIAQTAFALSGDRQKALKAGCDYYIAKPILPDTLFDIFKGINQRQ